MSDKFDKDRWILLMLKRRYLQVDPHTGDMWRAVKVNEAGYAVFSQLPPVLGVDYKKIAVQTHKPTGRVYTNITYLGITKSVLVNRVVALRYLPNPQNLPQVNHIDGDKSHNYLYQPTEALRAKWGKYQLEWASASENELHAHRTGLKTGRGTANSNAKLTPDDVREIRTSEAPAADLAVRFGVSRSTITSIRSGRTWTHV